MVATDETTETCSFSDNLRDSILNQDSQSLKSNISLNDSQGNSNNHGSERNMPASEVEFRPDLNFNANADPSTAPQEKGDKPKDEDGSPEKSKKKVDPLTWMKRTTLLILLFTNLLNYMDRYTIAGVLLDVQQFYDISNSQAGLLQTSFIISYMLMSPIFGYIGDRYNRKYAMTFGIVFWSFITLAGSFVPEDHFNFFLLLRALVGVGEASYSTIAPTIIADMFSKEQRTKALSVFYFAIPVGSGLGYIVGAQVASFAGHWAWALRVTPVFGFVCAILVMVVVVEPVRGASDGGLHLKHTTFQKDVKYLVRHKSFLTSTLGFTCVSFVAGALALWAPTYMYLSMKLLDKNADMSIVSFQFGVVTCIAGLLGVMMGFVLSHKFRSRFANADAIICATGLLLASPFLFFAILLSKHTSLVTWIFIFLGESLLSLNWALVTDILLYTVIPTRRSTAEALQILVSHALGDAGSPYLIGLTYDMLFEKYWKDSGDEGLYMSLQFSLYITCFVCILGAGCFLANSIVLSADKKAADDYIRKHLPTNQSNGSGTALIAMDENSLSDVPCSDLKCDPRALFPKNGIPNGHVNEITYV